MIFKGYRWTQSRKVVTLPREYCPGEFHNYVAFGRVCSKNTPGAVRTLFEWSSPTHQDGVELQSPQGDPPEMRENGDMYFPTYAVPVKQDASVLGKDNPVRGYSLTNLLRGADGYSYLFKDGKCYVRKTKQKVNS